MGRFTQDYDDYDPSEGRTYRRGCTCHVGFNWENGPCDYCNGDYECPDGCGEMACECKCDLKCPECCEIHEPFCKDEANE
jgi:hypothetical protein